MYKSATEMNYYVWVKHFANNLPREAIRNLQKILIDSSFNNLHIPSEYRINELDEINAQRIFTLKTIQFQGKSISFLPIIEIIKGCLRRDFFRH